MKAALRSIWCEIVQPSKPDEPAYYVMLIAVGHALLGASLAPLDIAAWFAAGRFAIPVIYWALKEWGDLRRGGSILDGLVDTGFVALGAIYAGQVWWPALVLASALCVSLAYVTWRSTHER
jgi:hypothetical protein